METEKIFGINYHYIWSDAWWLEGDNAWFVAGAMDILLCLDCNNNITKLIGEIPSDRVCEFRQHPRCLKKGDIIICLPDRANDIWLLRLSNNLWTRISLFNSQNVRIGCYNAWFIQDKLYIVSIGLKQIIELNIEKECVEKYYNITENVKVKISASLMQENCIYIVGNFPVTIYKFDCLTKNIQIYNLFEINDELNTICFDGEKFWLSGKQKRIYIWNEATEAAISMDIIPKCFGVWNFNGNYSDSLNYFNDALGMPLFINCVLGGQYVWFIPFQTNRIIYINKDTFQVKVFNIGDEDHTPDDIKLQLLQHKYLLEYIKDGRYIGLFSLKNKWVFEIDCKMLKYKILNYRIDESCRRLIKALIAQAYFKKDKIMLEDQYFNLRNVLQDFSKGTSQKNNFVLKNSKFNSKSKNIFSVLKD